MRIRPLTDESDRQALQCLQHGVHLDEEMDDEERYSGFGADPFDIVAEIEEQQGYALRSS